MNISCHPIERHTETFGDLTHEAKELYKVT